MDELSAGAVTRYLFIFDIDNKTRYPQSKLLKKTRYTARNPKEPLGILGNPKDY